jgi:hypothetical protein
LQEKGLNKRFTEEQWEVLQNLNDKEFRHKWQLATELAKDNCWKPRRMIAGEADKNYNRTLSAKLDILYRSFYREKAAK